MADSTPLLAQIAAGQAQKEVTANGLFDAASPATAYGRHAEACIGLTWAYYGTRYGGSTVANGTNVCGVSTTTYMVVNRATGAVSFSTATTNWDDPAAYARAYKIVTGASSVTSYEDHRFGPRGLSVVSDRRAVSVLSISSGVVDIDCSLGDYFTLALTANVTSITFSNLPAAGASLMIRITQDSTPRTVAWPASFKWAGSAGAVSTGSGAVDVLAITTFNAGTAWNATLAKAFA